MRPESVRVARTDVTVKGRVGAIRRITIIVALNLNLLQGWGGLLMMTDWLHMHMRVQDPFFLNVMISSRSFVCCYTCNIRRVFQAF